MHALLCYWYRVAAEFGIADVHFYRVFLEFVWKEYSDLGLVYVNQAGRISCWLSFREFGSTNYFVQICKYIECGLVSAFLYQRLFQLENAPEEVNGY